jgi:hypothetical protein
MFCRQFALVRAARPRVLRQNNLKLVRLNNAPRLKSSFNRGSKKDLPSQDASSDGGAQLLSKPLSWYSQKLDSHPLVTKCLTGCFILGNGDVLAQFVEGKDTWDALRTAHFALIGIIFQAPALHYWYQYLNKVFPGRTTKSIAQRVVWDQLAFNPPYLVIFLTMVWKSEGKDNGEIPDLIKNTFPSAMISNWLVWTPAQIFTFGWVPPKYQVLATNVVELGWNAYLSFCTHPHEPRTVNNSPAVVQNQHHKLVRSVTQRYTTTHRHHPSSKKEVNEMPSSSSSSGSSRHEPRLDQDQ